MIRDLAWKCGQRFIAGFEGTTVPDDLRRLVKEHKVGNIILFKRNVENRQQLRKLCDDLQELILQETGLPAFIAIDQEGGCVSRLPDDCAIVPTAMALAATGDPQNAYDAGVITARELNALGVNFNLAPVMDVNSNPMNPVIGARSYSDDPATVSTFGSAMIRGLEKGGVMSCAKHFPGHGDTAVDSHLGLPKVKKTLEELEACELIPFRAAIDAGVSAIMTTHILFPKLEKEHLPATMSKTIMQDVLRGRLGYDGLIVSDCMMMEAIAKYYGTVPGTLAACNAGVDMICICHDPTLTGEACAEVVKNGDSSMTDAAVERIIAAKEKLLSAGDVSIVGCEAHRARNCEMRAASITRVGAEVPKLGGNPFFVGCFPFVPSLVASPIERSVCFPEWMQKQFGGTCMVTEVNPPSASIAAAYKAAKDASCIVLCTFNAHMKQQQLVLMRALAELGKPMVVCAMRDPYDLMKLPEGACGLLAYEYSLDALEALRPVLAGEMEAEGKLSVRLS